MESLQVDQKIVTTFMQQWGDTLLTDGRFWTQGEDTPTSGRCTISVVESFIPGSSMPSILVHDVQIDWVTVYFVLGDRVLMTRRPALTVVSGIAEELSDQSIKNSWVGDTPPQKPIPKTGPIQGTTFPTNLNFGQFCDMLAALGHRFPTEFDYS